jgi:hypothetical protein
MAGCKTWSVILRLLGKGGQLRWASLLIDRVKGRRGVTTASTVLDGITERGIGFKKSVWFSL